MTPEMTVIIPLLMSAAETKLKSKLTFPTNAKMSAPNIRMEPEMPAIPKPGITRNSKMSRMMPMKAVFPSLRLIRRCKAE